MRVPPDFTTVTLLRLVLPVASTGTSSRGHDYGFVDVSILDADFYKNSPFIAERAILFLASKIIARPPICTR